MGDAKSTQPQIIKQLFQFYLLPFYFHLYFSGNQYSNPSGHMDYVKVWKWIYTGTIQICNITVCGQMLAQQEYDENTVHNELRMHFFCYVKPRFNQCIHLVHFYKTIDFVFVMCLFFICKDNSNMIKC